MAVIVNTIRVGQHENIETDSDTVDHHRELYDLPSW